MATVGQREGGAKPEGMGVRRRQRRESELIKCLGRLQRFKVTVNSHSHPASGLHELGLELPRTTASVRKTEADRVFGNPFLAKTEFSAGEQEEQMGALGRSPAGSPACLPVETSSSGNRELGRPAHGVMQHASGACLSVFKLPPPLPSQLLALSTWEPATPFHDSHYSLTVHICLRSLSALGDHAKLHECSPTLPGLYTVRQARGERKMLVTWGCE